VAHGEREVAVHAVRHGRRERATDPAHFVGITGRPQVVRPAEISASESPPGPSALLRSLDEYDAAAGGAW
jgi:hypothetical protein